MKGKVKERGVEGGKKNVIGTCMALRLVLQL